MWLNLQGWETVQLKLKTGKKVTFCVFVYRLKLEICKIEAALEYKNLLIDTPYLGVAPHIGAAMRGWNIQEGDSLQGRSFTQI